MILKDSLSIANAVLALVQGYELPDDCVLETYTNCRETGYSITNYATKQKVSFSGHRIGADSCVIYRGGFDDFDINTNQPKDGVYALDYGNTTHDLHEAAAQIHDWLTAESNVENENRRTAA